MNLEKFNPSSPGYEKVEDLPEPIRDNYVDLPKGDFVRKSAQENFEDVKIMANTDDLQGRFENKIVGGGEGQGRIEIHNNESEEEKRRRELEEEWNAKRKELGSL